MAKVQRVRKIKTRIDLKDSKGIQHLNESIYEIPQNFSQVVRERILTRAPKVIRDYAIANIEEGNERSTAKMTGNLADNTYVSASSRGQGDINLEAGVKGDVPYASIHNKSTGTRIKLRNAKYLRFYIARDKPGFNWHGKKDEKGGHWVIRKKSVLRPKREYLTKAVIKFEDEFPQMVADISRELSEENLDPLFRYNPKGMKVYLGGNRKASLHRDAATRLQDALAR